MALIYGRVKLQESLGTAATTFTENINFNFIANQMHLDLFMYKESATAASIQNLVDKISQVRISTQNGDPESTIDGDDLFEFPKYAFDNVHPHHTPLTATDNDPHVAGFLYPFSPFPQNSLANYGLPAGKGVQFIYDVAADVSGDFDGGVTDLIVEGVEIGDKGTDGYIKFQRDAHTFSAVGEQRDTLINGNRLLGVYNHMTTSYDDLAAAAAFDVVGIRDQQIMKSQNSVLKYKPIQTYAKMKQSHNSTDSAGGDFLDAGRFFHDLGIQQIPQGINIRNQGQVEIRTTAGVAEATRIMPVLLVN